jgi:hypothetical protein
VISKDEQRIFGVMNEDRSQVIVEERRKGTTLKFKGHANTIRVLRILESRNLMISAGNDKQVIVWDYQAKLRIKTFENLHKGHIISMTVSKDSSFVITGSYDSNLQIIRFGEKNSIDLVKKLNFTNRVYTICISSDDSILFCAGYNKKFLRRWEFCKDFDNKGLRTINEEKLNTADKEEDQKETFQSLLLSKVYDLRDPQDMDNLYISQHIGDFTSKKLSKDEDDQNTSLINISVNDNLSDVGEETSKDHAKPRIVVAKPPRRMFLSQVVPEMMEEKSGKYQNTDIKELLKPLEISHGMKMRKNEFREYSTKTVNRAEARSQILGKQNRVVSSRLNRLFGKSELDKETKSIGDYKSLLENVFDSEKEFLINLKEDVQKLKIKAEEIPKCEKIKDGLRNLKFDLQLKENKLLKSKIKTVNFQKDLIQSIQNDKEGLLIFCFNF